MIVHCEPERCHVFHRVLLLNSTDDYITDLLTVKEV